MLTLEYSAFIRVCPSVRMLCDTESSPAPNDVETGGIYCPSNQNHEAQLPLEHNLLSIITTSISLVCHVHCSAVTVPWNSCSRKLLFFFFLCQNVYIHTSPSIKITAKKRKYRTDLESKHCPIQFPSFCCSTPKTVPHFCLQNF